MSIRQRFAGFAFVVLMTSPLVAQDFKDIEPIPAPAADAPKDDLPPLNIPTPAGDVDLQPIPAEQPLTLEPAAEQATYESAVENVTPASESVSPVEGSIVEGPFGESTSLDPIVDETTAPQPIVLESPSTLANETTFSPTEYPAQSVEFQQQPIQLPPSQTTIASPSNAVVTQPAPSQMVVQSPVSPQTTSQQPSCACEQRNQSPTQQVVVNQQINQQVVSQPRVVQQAQPTRVIQQAQPTRVTQQAQPTRYYRVQPPRQPVQQVLRQAPQPSQQIKVVIRQTPQGRLYAVPATPQNQAYAASVQSTAKTQAQYRQPAQAVRPVGYTQIQVTESTQYRPVQVRVTETYQSQGPRTVVVPATSYVPGQPLRNAARRRAAEYGN